MLEKAYYTVLMLFLVILLEYNNVSVCLLHCIIIALVGSLGRFSHTMPRVLVFKPPLGDSASVNA